MERTIYARQPDLMRTAHKAACTAEDGRRSEKTARQRRGDGGEAAGKPGRRSQYCGAPDALLTQPPPEGADRGAIPGAAMRKGRDVYGAAKNHAATKTAAWQVKNRRLMTAADLWQQTAGRRRTYGSRRLDGGGGARAAARVTVPPPGPARGLGFFRLRAKQTSR